MKHDNEWLCKRYPFLIPRNWSGEVSWDTQYEYTLAEQFPTGWWKAFGVMMCEELREELIEHDYLDKFRFEEIKEKFGGLRCYTNTTYGGDIIDKYSCLSENICIKCGRPDVPMIGHGWISPECFDCYKKRNEEYGMFKTLPSTLDGWWEAYEADITDEDDDGRMSDKMSYRTLEGDDFVYHEVDISETAEKIRENWRSKHGDI